MLRPRIGLPVFDRHSKELNVSFKTMIDPSIKTLNKSIQQIQPKSVLGEALSYSLN